MDVVAGNTDGSHMPIVRKVEIRITYMVFGPSTYREGANHFVEFQLSDVSL